jgi:hypothetical protein
MASARFRLLAWGLVPTLPLLAQEAPVLVLALHPSGHAVQVGGGSRPQRILHPAVMFDGRAWKGLDPALQSGASGLPAFTLWNGPKAQGGPVAVPLGILAAQAFHLPEASLAQWFVAPAQGPAVPLKAVGGLQTHWACEAGWGIQVEGPSVGAGLRLAATTPLPVHYFEPGEPARVSPELWTQVRAAWRREEPGALKDWQRQNERDPWRGLPQRVDLRFQGAEVEVQVKEAWLPGGPRLLWVAALRHFGKAQDASPECQAPTAVMTALVLQESGRTPRILRARLSYQDCGEGWVPGPTELPFCLFAWRGRTYLLDTGLGLESSIYRLSEVHPTRGLLGDLALGGGSGC